MIYCLLISNSSLPVQAQKLEITNFPLTGNKYNDKTQDIKAESSRVSGDFWAPDTYGEYGTCVTGIVQGNTLNGEVFDFLYGGEQPSTEELNSSLTGWDPKGYLEVADGVIKNDRVHYRQAMLNLNSFYRYNLGEYLPPTSCSASKL